ncbi:MAG: indole-3-glycerol phosphate synthase TrpC [Candidatus Eiseniibacteriota bacterium]
MPANILHEIAERRRAAVAERRATYPDGLPTRPADLPEARRGVFRAALKRASPAAPLRFLCEIKRASPSKGLLRESFDVQELARAYADGGAAALSVLTEPHYFQGAPEYLTAARRASGLPCLLKDFLVDPWQLDEAVSLGADAVLLIVGLLPIPELERFQRLACARGLDSLVEVHTEAELEVALSIGADPIGINNRDLHTFEVDRSVTLRLREHVPPGIVVVSESGIATPGDVRMLTRAGVDAALVGEAFMREADVAGAVRAFARAAVESLPAAP